MKNELEIYKKAFVMMAEDFCNYMSCTGVERHKEDYMFQYLQKAKKETVNLSKKEKKELRRVLDKLYEAQNDDVICFERGSFYRYDYLSFHTKPIPHNRFYRTKTIRDEKSSKQLEVYDTIADVYSFNQHTQDGKRYKIDDLLGDDND